MRSCRPSPCSSPAVPRMRGLLQSSIEALTAIADRQRDPARLVGGVYAANTVGAIVGAVVTSLFLVGTFGSQFAQRTLISLALLSGLLMIVPSGTEIAGRARTRGWIAAVAAAVLATVVARAVP